MMICHKMSMQTVLVIKTHYYSINGCCLFVDIPGIQVPQASQLIPTRGKAPGSNFPLKS